MTPTVSQAKQWQPQSVQEQADEWQTAADAIEAQMQTAKLEQDQSVEFWDGTSGFAARAHILGVVQNGHTVSDVLVAAASAASNGASELTRLCSDLKLALETIKGEGFDVLEDGRVWVGYQQRLTAMVATSDGGDLATALAALETAAGRHTVFLQRLLATLGDADGDTARKIHEAFEPLALVAGVNRAVLDGPQTGLTAEAGQRDGVLLRDGSFTDGDLDRIGDILSSPMLTPDALEALARGEKVDSLPQGTYDYLNHLYNTAGKDGILDLADQLRERENSGDPNAASRLDGLANGLLILSNEEVSTGVSAGGYDRVPPSMRELVEYAQVPSRHDNGVYVDALDHSDKRNDLANFSRLLAESNPEFTGGTEFSMELAHASSTLVDEKDNMVNQIDFYDAEETATNLLDIAVRNEDSSYHLWNGTAADGSPLDFHRDEVLLPLLTHDFGDDGAIQAQMVDWIREDAVVTDPEDAGQVARAERAGETAQSIMQVLATTESGHTLANGEASNNFSRFIDIPASEGGRMSLGEVNPKLTQELSGALAPYMANIVDAPIDVKEASGTHGFGDIGPGDAARVAVILNGDPDSGAIFNGAALYQAQEIGNMFADYQAGGGQSVALGTSTGRLLSLVETGITGATVEANIDGDHLATEQMNRRSDAVAAYQAFGASAASLVPGPAGALGSAGINIWGRNELEAIAEAGNGFTPQMADKIIPGISAGGAINATDFSHSSSQMHSMLSHLGEQGKADFSQVPKEYLVDGKLVDYQTAVAVEDSLGSNGRISSHYHTILEDSGVATTDWGIYDRKLSEGAQKLTNLSDSMYATPGSMPSLSQLLDGSVDAPGLKEW